MKYAVISTHSCS